MSFRYLPATGARLAVAVVLLAAPHSARAAEELPSVIRSAGSGPWSATATWEGGRVPGADARVQIRTGHRVVYDAKSGVVIRSINVAGTLTFDPDRDTRLDVGLILIRAGETYSESGFDCESHARKPDPEVERPVLEVGAPNRPIGAKRTALIRLHDVGLDGESTPAIVCCGGRMDFHGTPLARTWVRLGSAADKEDRFITLTEAVPDWRVGDRIIITAARWAESGPKHTEERVITKNDGKRLDLNSELEYEHLGETKYRSVVANLSRNVVVESAEPKHARGHTMYHRHSTGAISYAEFRHLGKQGVLGRYSLHYHLCGDTMRGSYVLGASIHDSHNRFLTIHGTSYLVVRDCVGYRSVGHGFFMEDGTEVHNVLDHNLAAGVSRGRALPKQTLPSDGNDGAGFWWANSRNTWTRNVSADTYHGYHFHPMARDWFKAPVFEVPQPDGTRRTEDLRRIPFVRFEGNEAHGADAQGIRMEWSSVSADVAEMVGPDPRNPFLIRDLRIWGSCTGTWSRLPVLRTENLRIDKVMDGDEDPTTEMGSKEKILDQQAPTTVITHVNRAGARIVVQGTTADNGIVRRVVVNNKEARSVRNNFAEWEVTLDGVPKGLLRLKAHAEDESKNIEVRPHVVIVE